MKLKKNPKFDLRQNSAIYFAIGLNIMLYFTWQALELKTEEKAKIEIEYVNISHEIEEDIPITNFDVPPPPEIKTVAPEVITVIEDDTQEIEESVIESTETGQEDKIEAPSVVEVEDVIVEEVEEDIEVPFSVVETVPIFPGCQAISNTGLKSCFNEKILEHIKKTFRYPERAQDNGVQGRVYVFFVINADGHVSDIKTRGPDKILEKEAYRIVDLLPVMKPGMQRDKAVKVQYTIPITFRLVD